MRQVASNLLVKSTSRRKSSTDSLESASNHFPASEKLPQIAPNQHKPVVPDRHLRARTEARAHLSFGTI